MGMGNDIIKVLLSLSLSGTLLGVLVFVVKFLSKDKFSKKWQYYVWILVLLRMMVPITLPVNLVGQLFQKAEVRMEEAKGSNEGMNTGGMEEVRENQPETEEKQKEPSERAAPLSLTEQNREWMPPLWTLWAFGAVLALAIKLVDYRNFLNYMKANNRLAADEKCMTLMDDILIELEIGKNIPVYYNRLVVSPMLMGIWKPSIVVPDWSGISNEELRYILTHELIHYKRKDLWYKWFFQLVLCIHWFNPFLYAVHRDFNRYCELSCDEAVMKHCNLEQRKQYGNTLLTMADLGIAYRSNVLSMTLIENKKHLKERLKNIMDYKNKSKIMAAVSALVICLVALLGGIAGASITRNAVQAEGEKGETAAALQDQKQTNGPLGQTEDTAEAENGIQVNQPVEVSGINANQVEATADKIYFDDSLIAARDKTSVFYSNMYYGSDSPRYIKIGSFKLNGSSTCLGFHMKQKATIEVEYQVSVSSGKFKVVHINPDNKVKIIGEGSGEFKTSITLEKGRNRFKLVGLDNKSKELDLKFGNVDKNAVAYKFTSEGEESAYLFLNDVKSGKKVDVKELENIAPLVDSEDISECISLLLKRNEKFDYSLIEKLLPFLDSEDLADLLLPLIKNNKDAKLSWIRNAAPFLESEDLRECLKALEASGITITLSELRDLAPFMESEDLGEYLNKAGFTGKTGSARDLRNLAPFLDSEDLADCLKSLVKAGKTIDISDLAALAPFLDSEDLGYFASEAANHSIDDLMYLAPFLDSEDLGDLLIRQVEKGKKLDMDTLQDIAVFMDEDDVETLINKMVDKKMTTWEEIGMWFLNDDY